MADKARGADPEDKDEFKAENIFWVPNKARWPALQAAALPPSIGRKIDDAMVAIERDNSTLDADHVIAHPPVNLSDCGGDHLLEAVRCRYGRPPAGNASIAWVSKTVGRWAGTQILAPRFTRRLGVA